MTVMVGEIYDALRDAGVSEEKARRAAEVMASSEPEFARLRLAIADVKTSLGAEIAAVKASLGGEIADVRGDIRLLKWQVGAVFAILVPVLWLLLRIAAKVGALPT